MHLRGCIRNAGAQCAVSMTAGGPTGLADRTGGNRATLAVAWCSFLIGDVRLCRRGLVRSVARIPPLPGTPGRQRCRQSGQLISPGADPFAVRPHLISRSPDEPGSAGRSGRRKQPPARRPARRVLSHGHPGQPLRTGASGSSHRPDVPASWCRRPGASLPEGATARPRYTRPGPFGMMRSRTAGPPQ
jgi:hypothetical protein